jgi:hypothetical protein
MEDAECAAHWPKSDGALFDGWFGFFFTHLYGDFKVHFLFPESRSAFQWQLAYDRVYGAWRKEPD